MSKLTGNDLDRKVAHAMGLKSVHNCEAWGQAHMKTPEDEEFERIEREQAKGWRKRQIEDKKERRCPACHHLLEDDREAND
jgi:hypothetical protein